MVSVRHKKRKGVKRVGGHSPSSQLVRFPTFGYLIHSGRRGHAYWSRQTSLSPVMATLTWMRSHHVLRGREIPVSWPCAGHRQRHWVSHSSNSGRQKLRCRTKKAPTLDIDAHRGGRPKQMPSCHEAELNHLAGSLRHPIRPFSGDFLWSQHRGRCCVGCCSLLSRRRPGHDAGMKRRESPRATAVNNKRIIYISPLGKLMRVRLRVSVRLRGRGRAPPRARGRTTGSYSGLGFALSFTK